MKSGDIYQVADVVRNLSFKQKRKGSFYRREKNVE